MGLFNIFKKKKKIINSFSFNFLDTEYKINLHDDNTTGTEIIVDEEKRKNRKIEAEKREEEYRRYCKKYNTETIIKNLYHLSYSVERNSLMEIPKTINEIKQIINGYKYEDDVFTEVWNTTISEEVKNNLLILSIYTERSSFFSNPNDFLALLTLSLITLRVNYCKGKMENLKRESAINRHKSNLISELNSLKELVNSSDKKIIEYIDEIIAMYDNSNI
uniref:hypothetical protein n=1 Tax=Ornithobacterium rhinotracheale TaxID=28251 RepID=UPI0039A6E922